MNAPKLRLHPELFKKGGAEGVIANLAGGCWTTSSKSENQTAGELCRSLCRNQSAQVVQLRNSSTYSGFIDALWRGVCIRLMFEMISDLEKGRSFSFGDIRIEDGAVTLWRHKFLGANECVKIGWHDVHVWSKDGSFVVGHKDDKKSYGSASYIDVPNTHIIEHIIRGGFKKGVRKLSDYLKD
jgi:hypothetical protein